MADTVTEEAALDAVREQLPVAPCAFDTRALKCGLVVVDEVNGFATVGAGALAPREPNAQVSRMVEETDRWPAPSPSAACPSPRSSTPTSRANRNLPIRPTAKGAPGRRSWCRRSSGSTTVPRRR